VRTIGIFDFLKTENQSLVRPNLAGSPAMSTVRRLRLLFASLCRVLEVYEARAHPGDGR